MLTVFLENQQITAPIGWYEEERRAGVILSVTVHVGVKSPVHADEIAETVDYAKLLEIVLQEGHTERKLLESYAKDIIHHINRVYNGKIAFTEVTIRKKNLPVAGFDGDGVGIVLKEVY